MAAIPSRGRAGRVERPADAAGDLYERYSEQVFGYCFHQLGSREEAEDAVQTTFMNAFRGLARGIVPKVEQAWVFKIAHNVCLSRRRSSWRRRRVEAPNNLEVLQEVVPAKEKVADELIPLQEVLEEMPDNQRRAILLREWQGLSYREIAEELDVSQGAVETLIFRARRTLAVGLEEAPAEGVWRKRLRRGTDVGGLLAFLKAMLGGGGAAAIKVATVVALAGAAVATTAADHMLPRQDAPAKAPVDVALRHSPQQAVSVSSQPARGGPVDVPRARAAATRPARVHRPARPRPAPRSHSAPVTQPVSQPVSAPPAAKEEPPAPVPPAIPVAEVSHGTSPAPPGSEPKVPFGTHAKPPEAAAPGATEGTEKPNEKAPDPDTGPVTHAPSDPGG